MALTWAARASLKAVDRKRVNAFCHAAPLARLDGMRFFEHEAERLVNHKTSIRRCT
jgi:hypothetical protein